MEVVPCSVCALPVGCRRLRVRCDGCDANLCGYCADFVGVEDKFAAAPSPPVAKTCGEGDSIRALGEASSVLPLPVPLPLLEALLGAQRSGRVVPSTIPLMIKNGSVVMAGGGMAPDVTCTIWCGQCKLHSSSSRPHSPKRDDKLCSQCGSKVAGFGSFNNKRRTCGGCGASVCSKNCSRSVVRPGKGVVVLCSQCIVSGV